MFTNKVRFGVQKMGVTTGYIKAYETMIEYIRRFDRAYQLCGRGFDGEKADALEDTVSECYFGYWEATRY